MTLDQQNLKVGISIKHSLNQKADISHFRFCKLHQLLIAKQGHAAAGDLRRDNDVHAENEECAEQYRNEYMSNGRRTMKQLFKNLI
ncbi:hypothetical protein T07_3837 [Trichinella nelsoni]|uniref:Uncharacterized protein n=1 Tax=Trichinella nelsoni TaxID=6336 RepID=A0A0V0SKF1_9BILA|nr:hypothetical protein T07_3837 [Trichinella nelsoni]